MRTPTRRRIGFIIAAVLGLTWAVGGEVIGAVHAWGGNHLLEFLCGLSFLWSGLFAMYRRFGDPIGKLLSIYGILFYLSFWSSMFPPVLQALADTVDAAAYNALLLHIAVVYPTGKIMTRFGRVLTITVYAWNLMVQFAEQAVTDRSPWHCDATHYCRATFSMWLWPSSSMYTTVWTIGAWSTPLILVLLALAIGQRWRMSSPAERVDLHPLWITLIVVGGALTVQQVGGLLKLSDAWLSTVTDFQLIAQLAGPITIVYGLVHSEHAELARRNAELTAIVQAQLRDVRASRARIVAAGDAERRRVEHDLHDGAQQRLLSVVVALRLAEQAAEQGTAGTATAIAEAGAELRTAIDELRDLARGIHPSVLTDAGLGEAVRALARRSAVPVTELVVIEERLPADVEATGYFVVAEALANVVKHAQASQAWIRVTREANAVRIEVIDDGHGGASEAGAGLQGLADRVAAVGGRLTISSPPGTGTTLDVTIPLDAPISLDATIPLGAEVTT